ncbi:MULTISPECIES: Tse2 family ADP-ribosyltransferase toxin [unclassified Microcoleus]|uniref:Tse2 family ADP-ribosyltransferase toxin n=1 Tax=unclassified Microcoleus TaxID=2642155 RepID=UPI002FD3E88F
MAETPIGLYPQGNANSPRMDNVRPNKDVATYEENGRIWVDPTLGGGISTFATQRSDKNWWKLDAESEIPAALDLVNDHNDHWLWKPSHIMPIDEYKEALRLISASFYKVS